MKFSEEFLKFVKSSAASKTSKNCLEIFQEFLKFHPYIFGIFFRIQYNLRVKTSFWLLCRKIKENLSENFTFATQTNVFSGYSPKHSADSFSVETALWFGFCWCLSSAFNLIIYSSEFTTENSRKWDRFVTYRTLLVLKIISECFHYVWIYAQNFYANSHELECFYLFNPSLNSLQSCHVSTSFRENLGKANKSFLRRQKSVKISSPLRIKNKLNKMKNSSNLTCNALGWSH